MPAPSDISSLHVIAADQLAPERLHAAFTGAFSDYLIGAFDIGIALWPSFLARQAVDLSLSRVALLGEDVAAFAFCAPRAGMGIWRLATMGAPPAMRGSGAAKVLLDDLIARATREQLRAVELECFAQNERAIALYRGRGFEEIVPLYGYTRAAGDAQLAGEGEPVALDDAYGWIDGVNWALDGLPLQVTGASLSALPAKLQARRFGTAQVVFSENSQGLVTINSLVDAQPAQVDAEVLVRGLLRDYADLRFSVPQLQRPDVGGEALERCGFERLALHQVLMQRFL